MIRYTLALVLCCCSLCGEQQTPPAQQVWAKSAIVEIRGVIERVQVMPGQGTPYLEVKGERGTQLVMLGDMRYLLEQNFNPKAGSNAIVKAFRVGDTIIAQSVTIPSERLHIQLWDDNGVPLWRMDRYGWKGK